MKKLIMILMLIISSFTLLAEDNLEKDIMDIKGRLEKIEENRVDLKVQKMLFETEKERLASELNERIDLTLKNGLLTKRIKVEKDLKDKVDKNEEGVTDWKNWKIISGVILIFLGFGTFGGYVAVYQYIKFQTKKRVDEKLDNLLEEKKDIFLELIKENQVENQLKKNSKLLVVSKSTEPQELYKEYENIKYQTPENFAVTDEKLIVIDNIDSIFAEEILLNIHGNRKGLPILHFLKTNDSKLFRKEDVYFANNKVTLKTHLINILKYS